MKSLHQNYPDTSFAEKLIQRSPLETSKQREILRTYKQLILFKESELSSTNYLNILGYNVCFTSLQNLKQFFYEIFVETQYYFHTEKEKPLIIDGGSNFGLSIFFFKYVYPNCKIIAFEPEEKAYEILKRNIETNRLKDVKLENFAVGKESEEAEFYSDPDNPGSPIASLNNERMSKKTTTINQKRLSNYIDRGIDFLKLDVEGAETDILSELVSASKMPWFEQGIIEYHHHITPSEDKFSEILKLLENENFGYQITSFAHPKKRKQNKDAFQDILLFIYNKSKK